MKKVVAIVIAFIMVLSISVPAFAEGGAWYLNDQGWWYLNEDGTFPAGEWLLYNDSWYLFDADGYMMTGWALYNGEWYYLNGAGIMETGWIWDGNAWYLMGENGAWTGQKAVEEPADNDAGQGGAGKSDNKAAGGAAGITTKSMVDKITGNEEEPGNKAEEPAEEPTKPAEEPTDPAEEPTQPEVEPTQPADNNGGQSNAEVPNNNGKKINATVVLSDGTNCPVISCTEENDGSTAKLSVTFSVDASKGIYNSFIATFGESVVFNEDHINNEILKNASKLPFGSSSSNPLTAITLNLQLSKDIHTNLFDASAVYCIARNFDKDGNQISYTKIAFDRGISGSGNSGASNQPANNNTPNSDSNGSQGKGETPNSSNTGSGTSNLVTSETATITVDHSDGTKSTATFTVHDSQMGGYDVQYSIDASKGVYSFNVAGAGTDDTLYKDPAGVSHLMELYAKNDQMISSTSPLATVDCLVPPNIGEEPLYALVLYYDKEGNVIPSYYSLLTITP